MHTKRIVTFVLFVSLITAVLIISPVQQEIVARSESTISIPQPYMVKNINEANSSSIPECPIALDRFMLCAVDDGIHGRELWRSDGTEAGSMILKDIMPGEEGSEPDALNQRNRPAMGEASKYILFNADDGQHGTELWKTDGTPQGTVFVKDINPGPAHSGVDWIMAVGDNYFLTAYSSPDYDKQDLWISDGTAAGTKMVKNNFTDAFGNPRYLVEFDGLLYFVADDGSHGFELWRSDGTSAGTRMVKDINPHGSGNPSSLTTLNGSLYFLAEDGVHGVDLWKTDGSEAGTRIVKDIDDSAESSAFFEMVLVNNTLYFSNSDGDPDLWRSDGTEAGTFLLKEVDADTLTAAGSKLFFRTYPPTTLWVSDGSAAGTIPLREFPHGFGDCKSDFFAAGDSIYACFLDEVYGMELWTSNGTVSGTRLVRDLMPGFDHSRPIPQIEFGGLLYFEARVFDDRELWVTDGSEAGTRLAMDFNTSDDADSSPGPFSPLGGNGEQIMFRATGKEVGSEPFISDGTELGTNVLKDIVPGPVSSLYWTDTADMMPVALEDGRFYFTAEDGSRRTLVLTSDGTESGTTMVLRTCPTVKFLSATANRVFFTGILEDSPGVCTYSSETLWRSDGTSGGTASIVAEDGLELLAATSSHLFFRYDSPAGRPYGLWAVGESDIEPIGIVDYISSAAIAGDALFFYGREADEPIYLWKSDGSQTGTTKIKSVNSVGSTYPAGDLLYFVDKSGENTNALWQTDGTAAGAKLVKDGWTDEKRIGVLTGSGDVAFFVVEIGGEEYHRELWRTDGTPGGTKRVKDFPHWSDDPIIMAVFKNLVFFNADDGLHGHELWVSNGTEAGTVMHADINPLEGQGSQLHNLAARDHALYFAADDGLHGIELWALRIGEPDSPTADFSASPLVGVSPLLVQFQNLSSGTLDTCTWDFGDGKSKTTCGDTQHIYRQEGSYTVSLTVRGAGGEATMTKENYIVVEKHRAFLPSVVRP